MILSDLYRVKVFFENIRVRLRRLAMTDEEKKSFLPVICETNSQNLKYISMFAIITSTLQIVVFYLRSREATGTEWVWRQHIIYAHLAIIGFFMLISVYMYVIRDRQKFSFAWRKPLLHISFLFILFSGAAIACFDQLSTQAITPFLMVIVVVSLLIFISPFFSKIWFSAAFLFFSFLLPVFQPDKTIILSHQINALSVIVVGFLLNLIMWDNTLKHLRQSGSIRSQQQLLEKQNAELLHKTKELKRVNALRDKLFTTIAHDLRNPFHVLLSSSEILLDEEAALTAEDEKTLKRFIQKTSQSAYLRLQNLLEWGQIQRNKVQLTLQLTDMGELIENSIREFEMAIHEKKLTVDKNLSNFKAEIDPVLIGSAIRNLVSNAVKFTPRNGKIGVECNLNHQFFTIRVSDTGIGMPPEMVKNLFNPDNGTGRAGTEGESSTGIGLQLSKEFVEMHGGKISVKSIENEGTMLTVKIPVTHNRVEQRQKSGKVFQEA